VRAGLVLTATASDLRRNLVMTLGTIVTVGICLTMFGAGLLMRAEARTVDGYLLSKIQVVIDLNDAITPAEQAALAADLRSDPLVASFTYESKGQAYRRFRTDFRDSPDVVAGVGPDDLPASFRLSLVDSRRAGDIVAAYGGLDGVDRVRDQRALLAPLYAVLHGFTVGAFTLALVQALAALALIYTSIRTSAHGRRRETSIMRLVGATNAAIRAPFVLESAVSAFAGGVVAAVTLVVLKVYLVDHRFARQRVFPLFGWGTVWSVAVGMIVVGVLVAAGMSVVALRRHLRV
jgi:cell division transport system permease protein